MTEICPCSKFTPATRILLMAARAGLPKIIIAAVESGADMKAREYDEDHPDTGYNALALVTLGGFFDCIKILIALGDDYNVLIQKGATLLIVAALNGNEKIGEYYISLGVPIDVVDGDGDSAMSVAKRLGHEKFVAMLNAHKQ